MAYTEWLAAQPEFQGLTWRAYTVPRNMFPKLRLKYRPNLISLKGGMQDLPITGAHLLPYRTTFSPSSEFRDVVLRQIS